MAKLTIWFIIGILLTYLMFTSGFVYWASRCEVTDKLITPYSWSMSAGKGFTPIALKGDIDCIHWILNESDQGMMVASDSNGVLLLEGHMEYVGMNPKRQDRFEDINNIFSLNRCYLFLTDWSIRHMKYTYCADVGLRWNFPFDISDNGDGILSYTADVPDIFGNISVKTVFIKEVYRSGNARVYEKVIQ